MHCASLRPWLTLAVAVALLTVPGCRQSNLPGPAGTVSGTARYQNKPIPEGSAIVFVHNETGIIGTGVTNAAGEFQIRMRERKEVLVGDYTVHIRPPGEPDPNLMQFTMENVPPAWKLVPKRYWMSHTSAEKFSVREGQNTYNLTLHD